MATGIARLLLAVLLLYFSVADPDSFGYRHEADDGWALSYVVVSLAFLLVAVRSWWWDFQLRGIALATDIVIIVVIEHIEPVHYGFFTLGIAIAACTLLTTALRFGERATWRAAIALNLVAMVVCGVRNLPIFYPATHVTGEIDMWMDLRHVLFHLTVSALALWLARQIGPVARLPRLEAAGSDTSGLEAALAYAARVTGARRGVLYWQDPARSAPHMVAYGDAEDVAEAMAARFKKVPARDIPTPVLFGIDPVRALTIGKDGEIAIQPVRGGLDQMASLSGFREGLSLPVPCASGLAWLVLADLPPLGTDLLRASEVIGSEIAYGIDRGQFEQISREAAMNGLRNSIARDLHDSVAQSLAGAGYWLQALQLRQDMPDHVRAEIARTKAALDKENSGIRVIIDRLRTDLDLDVPRYLGGEIRGLLDVLGQQWRIDIAFREPPRELLVAAATAHDIQQILREALANAVRHGNAGHVDVTVVSNESRLVIDIEDDGAGFPTVPVDEPPRSLSERVEALGGHLDAGNGAKGARVTIDLPGELLK